MAADVGSCVAGAMLKRAGRAKVGSELQNVTSDACLYVNGGPHDVVRHGREDCGRDRCH